MNVPAVHVRMVEHVWTKSIPTTVPVQPAIQVQTVDPVSILEAMYYIDIVYKETRMDQNYKIVLVERQCNICKWTVESLFILHFIHC